MADSTKLDNIEIKLDAVIDKVEDIREKTTDTRVIIAKIETTLAAQHNQLADHIKRTDLLEEKVEKHQQIMTQIRGAVNFIKVVGFAAALLEALRMLKIL